MNEAWSPSITRHDGTLHDRLLRALREDITSGALIPDGKMPPHRELAARLGIGVGTVTRAYAEAERLGLLTSAVGRGTFVTRRGAAPAVADDLAMPIDLSLNVQALDDVASRLGEAMLRVTSRPDIGSYAAYAPHPGLDWHRQTLAEWLQREARYATLDWRRLVITSGSQHGMALAVDELCKPGDVILTEAATFNGIKAIADYRGLRCVGLAMDGEGIVPDALEAAIRTTGSRMLYLQPTLQNPTTRTMSRDRRLEIVRIAREHDLTLLEDDVYAPIAFALRGGATHPELQPLAMLAPERTYYLGSVSKALTPGLRVGMLVAPDQQRLDRLCAAMRANCWATDTLGPLIVSQWIKDGVAHDLLGRVAQEASERLTLARRMLGDAVEHPSFPTSLHVWLPMSELRAERVANGAMRRGVILTAPSSFLVAGEAVSGLRVCLNVVPRPALERALRIVRSVLADESDAARMSVI